MTTGAIPKQRLVHFIGKDNIVFHAIVWPATLMAHGEFILPAQIPANEFLNIEGKKISTSRNWAVWVDEYLDVFPPDPLRYCFEANAPENKDADFTWKDFQTRNNSELADVLGNLINRCLSFVEKHFEAKVPPAGHLTDADRAVFAAIGESHAIGSAQPWMSFQVRRATAELMDLARAGNKYFNDAHPGLRSKAIAHAARTILNTTLQLQAALAVSDGAVPAVFRRKTLAHAERTRFAPRSALVRRP